MDLAGQYHAAIEDALRIFGMSDKLAHVHVGMAIFLIAQFVLRTRRGSGTALMVVIAAELFNEVMDRLYSGSWNWPDTLGDIVATVFWPTMLVLFSGYRRRQWERREAYRRLIATMMPEPRPAPTH